MKASISRMFSCPDKKSRADDDDDENSSENDESEPIEAENNDEENTLTASINNEDIQRRQERREMEYKNRLIQGQREREAKASSIRQYAKQQRVRYFHKLSDQWIEDVVIEGVHYDDGPDKPYYTIKYIRPDDGIVLEKQTTDDRLEAADFDEHKTWAILESKVKR